MKFKVLLVIVQVIDLLAKIFANSEEASRNIFFMLLGIQKKQFGWLICYLELKAKGLFAQKLKIYSLNHPDVEISIQLPQRITHAL